MEQADFKIVEDDETVETVETVTNSTTENQQEQTYGEFKVGFKDWVRYKLRKVIIILILAFLTWALWSLAIAVSNSNGVGGVWIWLFFWQHILGLWMITGICGIATIFNFIGLFKRIDPIHFQMWKEQINARKGR